MKLKSPYPGVHRSSKVLADGTIKTYFYAWKSGPRLPDSFGTDEFARAFLEAQAAKPAVIDPHKLFQIAIDKYQLSRGKRKRGADTVAFSIWRRGRRTTTARSSGRM